MSDDLISISSLTLKAIVGSDSWGKAKLQTILLSFSMRTNISAAGKTDHLPYSIHYGTANKIVSEFVENKTFETIEDIAEGVCNVLLSEKLKGVWIKLRVEKPRELLRAETSGLEIIRSIPCDNVKSVADSMFVRNLSLLTIIGIHPWERKERQPVLLNMTFYKSSDTNFWWSEGYNLRSIVHQTCEHVETSSYLTIEALITSIAKLLCVNLNISKVTISASKPYALSFAIPAVEITRDKTYFETNQNVYLTLSSNVRSRAQNLSDAIKQLNERGIMVVDTSFLYETKAMVNTVHPCFLYAAVCVETELSPDELFRELKLIENEIEETKTVLQGSRKIVLDILLYKDTLLECDGFSIPHKLILKEPVFLAPLVDISPELRHPLTNSTVVYHLSLLSSSNNTSIIKYLPLPRNRHIIFERGGARQIMAVLNFPFDYFSKDNEHVDIDIVNTVKEMIHDGATIIEITSCSFIGTSISEEEESRRIIYPIKVIREARIDVCISVNTFRAEIARRAVEAGADIVNDVSGGSLDPSMFQTVAELNVPIVIRSSSSAAQTTLTPTQVKENTFGTLCESMVKCVKQAIHAGIKRWNIILDPSFGTNKTHEDDLDLICRLPDLVHHQAFRNIPFLFEPLASRIIDSSNGVEKETTCIWSTASALAVCVVFGADIIRVHHLKEMAQVIKVADAIRIQQYKKNLL
ncbi:unnamed protein product [Adineta ricciae]|uniref:2-amino-4-hydroxy-6-hydroxymethyldihydropteridine diphosphokinase n=1 Tax=Adineta ricciae TaxID=249248 RepID=A0A814C820_ADIRI|nr:unnamed protein product [Adineta ricciae]